MLLRGSMCLLTYVRFMHNKGPSIHSLTMLTLCILVSVLSVDKDCLPFVYARRSSTLEMLVEY